MINYKYNIYNNQRLHVNIYIFDDKYSIIKSDKLINPEFKKNIGNVIFI